MASKTTRSNQSKPDLNQNDFQLSNYSLNCIKLLSDECTISSFRSQPLSRFRENLRELFHKLLKSLDELYDVRTTADFHHQYSSNCQRSIIAAITDRTGIVWEGVCKERNVDFVNVILDSICSCAGVCCGSYAVGMTPIVHALIIILATHTLPLEVDCRSGTCIMFQRVLTLLDAHPSVSVGRLLDVIIHEAFIGRENGLNTFPIFKSLNKTNVMFMVTKLCLHQHFLCPNVFAAITSVLLSIGPCCMDLNSRKENDFDPSLPAQKRRRAMRKGNITLLHEGGENVEMETASMMIVSVSNARGEVGNEFVVSKTRKQNNGEVTLNGKSAQQQSSTGTIVTVFEWMMSLYTSIALSSTSEEPSIHKIIELACQHPRSVAKVCVLAMTSSRKGRPIKVLLSGIWLKLEMAMVTSTVSTDLIEELLRMYTEIIVSSSVFDNDVSGCSEAIIPLLRCADNLSFQLLEKTTIRISIIYESLIRSISCVLFCRRKEVSTSQTLMDFLTKIFSREINIESDGIPLEDHTKLVYTLKLLGVLSPFFHNEKLLKTETYNLSSEKWPYSDEFSISHFIPRIFPNLKELLSDHGETIATFQEISKCAETYNDFKDYDPLLEYVHDDGLLRHIISYLNFSSVCKIGKTCRIFDRLCFERRVWRSLYYRKWKYDIEGVTFDSNNAEWFNLFRDKYRVECGLRGMRSSRGFKYSLCCRVGCYAILRSEYQTKQHMKKHEREDGRHVKNELKLLGVI